MSMGTVKWFNPDRGYGFIARPDADDLFFHINAVRGAGDRQPETGDQVSFEVAQTERGPRAVSVRIQVKGSAAVPAAPAGVPPAGPRTDISQ